MRQMPGHRHPVESGAGLVDERGRVREHQHELLGGCAVARGDGVLLGDRVDGDAELVARLVERDFAGSAEVVVELPEPGKAVRVGRGVRNQCLRKEGESGLANLVRRRLAVPPGVAGFGVEVRPTEGFRASSSVYGAGSSPRVAQGGGRTRVVPSRRGRRVLAEVSGGVRAGPRAGPWCGSVAGEAAPARRAGW
ncbi:hypothetical protein GCM10010400_46750 [Streptomyces aculeolatus]